MTGFSFNKSRGLFLAGLSAFLVVVGCSSESSSREPAPLSSAGDHAAARDAALCEHGVPEGICALCNPSLVAEYKAKGDWCGGHGVPESQCFKCNPNLTFAEASSVEPTQAAPVGEAWCDEHAVPEDKCTKCKPALIAKFIEAGDFCREHGLPESVCPYCNPEIAKAAGKAPPVFPPPGTKVELASVAIAEKAGVATAIARVEQQAGTLSVVGSLDFNQNRLARLSARSDSLVSVVNIDIGESVKAGAALVELTSGGVGESQSRLAAARARVETARLAAEREARLAEKGISSRRDAEAARADLAAAEAEHAAALADLRAAGAGTGGGGGRYALTAPFAGTVVERHAVVGQTASTGDVLVAVADLSTLWALLDVPEESASLVRPGQKVKLRLDGSRTVIEASVSRVAASVDPGSRTVEVRVDVPNEQGVLKAGQFLRAEIEVTSSESAVVVPAEALQEAEGQQLVFRKIGPTTFEPLNVELAALRDGLAVVRRGLEPGTEVVTTGAFLMKTEILKDSIGAGCADD